MSTGGPDPGSGTVTGIPHIPSEGAQVKRILILIGLPVLAVAVVALVLVVGSGGGSDGVNASAAASAPAPARSAVRVRSGSLGKYLVDAHGRTLYLFEKDKRAKSTCSGACASAWPPARTSRHPKAGAGVHAARLSSIPRADGGRQLTYAGHPLYRYAGDQAAGDTNGQDLDQFGGGWYVVSPAGAKIESDEGDGS
jgi:predicted lipoprotein with Yx(FWY)xxD motif